MALRREQYHVIETGSVAEAIGRLKGESYDLIVTDLMMEPLNGFDLLTLVKQHHPGCPVIIITAFGGPEVRAEALRRGAVDFLDKPLQLPALLQRVQEILTRREGGSIYGSEDSDRR
jgi:DNA-binding NtrC family response regulator